MSEENPLPPPPPVEETPKPLAPEPPKAPTAEQAIELLDEQMHLVTQQFFDKMDKIVQQLRDAVNNPNIPEDKKQKLRELLEKYEEILALIQEMGADYINTLSDSESSDSDQQGGASEFDQFDLPPNVREKVNKLFGSSRPRRTWISTPHGPSHFTMPITPPPPPPPPAPPAAPPAKPSRGKSVKRNRNRNRRMTYRLRRRT